MYILIGFLAGIIGGMGIGGGTILIPMLTILMGIDQKIAQSTNLISYFPLAIVAIIIHIKNKKIDKKMSLKFIPFGIIGSIIGSLFAVKLSSDILKISFAIFLLIMGIYELCCKE